MGGATRCGRGVLEKDCNGESLGSQRRWGAVRDSGQEAAGRQGHQSLAELTGLCWTLASIPSEASQLVGQLEATRRTFTDPVQ